MLNSYRKPRLEITPELLSSYKYNDDIAYINGDNFAYKADIPFENTELNKYIEQLSSEEFSPVLTTKETKKEEGDLSHIAGFVQYVERDICLKDLERFENLILDKNEPDTSENARKLLYNPYDGIRYYAKTNTLIVPECILSILPARCLVACYNLEAADSIYYWFNPCLKNYLVPKLEFVGIPETIKYSVFEEKKCIEKETPFGKAQCLYLNLPYEYYSKACCVDNETLAYSFNDRYFIGHSNCNESKLNHLCYDIAVNDFKKPLQFKLLDNGRIMPYMSNKRFLMALYLKLPYIPAVVCLDSVSFYEEEKNWYSPKEDVSKIANELFAPYFIS